MRRPSASTNADPALVVASLVSELEWQRTVTETAELLGWWVWHDRDSRTNAPGMPDLLLIHPGQGRVLFVELKREGKHLRSAQADVIRRLIEFPALECYVLSPSDKDTMTVILQGAAFPFALRRQAMVAEIEHAGWV